jgi:hypothetical protein
MMCWPFLLVPYFPRVFGELRLLFVVWMVVIGKILTLGYLKKRNVIVVDWSCMCKRSGESIDHLLLQFSVFLVFSGLSLEG